MMNTSTILHVKSTHAQERSVKTLFCTPQRMHHQCMIHGNLSTGRIISCVVRLERIKFFALEIFSTF